MLKYILSLLTVSILFSCNDNAGTKTNADTTKQKDTAQLSGAATAMRTPPRKPKMDASMAIDRIKKLDKIYKHGSYNGPYITEFDVADLQEIFCSNPDKIVSARFLLALLDTTDEGHRPYSVPQVILQIGTVPFNSANLLPPPIPTYSYYNTNKICPPPEGSCKIQ